MDGDTNRLKYVVAHLLVAFLGYYNSSLKRLIFQVNKMLILNHSFEGPYRIGKKLIDRAAIYVILTSTNRVIDVGQSGETGTRLLKHDRKNCWSRNNGTHFVVKWMPSDTYTKEDREKLEKVIRNKYNPTCGKI